MAEPQDWWQKAEIVTKIVSSIAAIFLPIALLIVGNQLTQRQKGIEYSKQQAESKASRLTTIVDQLSSENIKKRQLAIKVAEFLGKNDQLPRELIPALMVIIQSDPSKDVSTEARESLENIAKRNPAIEQTINKVMSGRWWKSEEGVIIRGS